MGTPFACDLTALSVEQRTRHRALTAGLRAAVAAFEEIADGYAASFPFDPATVLQLAEFITLEHLCCPFFTLGVEIAGEPEALRLTICGADGIKPFIRAEFAIPE